MALVDVRPDIKLDEAVACYRADAAIWEEIGDIYGLVAALLNCALIHAYRGYWQAGRQGGGRVWQLAWPKATMTCGPGSACSGVAKPWPRAMTKLLLTTGAKPLRWAAR
ncbi:MAG: hypothetical protein WBW48_11060 [Anaerolineae bacterium]